MTEAELWDQFVQWMIAGGESLEGYISILFAVYCEHPEPVVVF